MKKKYTKCGYVYYELTLAELRKGFVAFGVCDNCCTELENTETVFFIPVLNMLTYCKKCFERWNDTAIYYEEDMPFEEKTVAYIESKLRYN